MAGLIHTALRRLLPGGMAWRMTGASSNMLDGLADSLARPMAFLRNVQIEALPSTAEATIDEWLALLGVVVQPGATLGDKRKIASAAFTAIGGQSKDYINAKIREVFPNVTIDEPISGESGESGLGECGAATCDGGGGFGLFYYVRGFYRFAREYFTLAAMLVRLAPTHLSAIFEVRSTIDGDVARCGIGSTGRAYCGRRVTEYKPTDGQVARAGTGVAGIAITGRIPE